MRVTLFKLKKPKGFVYRPRHFDPVMDDLHSRVQIIEADIREDNKVDGSQMTRSRMRKAWNTPGTRKTANKKSNLRIAIIAILLFGFFYAYLFTDLLS